MATKETLLPVTDTVPLGNHWLDSCGRPCLLQTTRADGPSAFAYHFPPDRRRITLPATIRYGIGIARVLERHTQAPHASVPAVQGLVATVHYVLGCPPRTGRQPVREDEGKDMDGSQPDVSGAQPRGGDRGRGADGADAGRRARVGRRRCGRGRATHQSGARRVASRGSSLPHHRGA